MKSLYKRRIHIVGMRHDLGQSRRGVDMGPSAIRFAGLNKSLDEMDYKVIDDGDISCCTFETGNMGDPKLRFLEDIVDHCQKLRDYIKRIGEKGDFPLILGGDHSITIGSVAGLTYLYKEIGLIYMDAHGDFNTPETTQSGNIHGMSLATVLGLGNPLLTHLGARFPMINKDSVVLIGVRQLDPLEKKNLKESNIKIFTIKDIDELGVSEVMTKAIKIVTGEDGERPFHFSFDIDTVEPSVAPGTGTIVTGGLTYREAHLVCELVAESKKMVSMEVVEVNPILDYANKTGKLAVELITSALGKTIL